MPRAVVDVRRAGDRYLTSADGVSTWHCFSFGPHYDPANVAFGPLVAVNDEMLEPGAGFATHRHRDVEIVTWLVSGALVHEGRASERHLIRPGMVQRLSAGAGTEHAEMAAVGQSGLVAIGPTRFIQMWIAPDAFGGLANYATHRIDPLALRSGYAVLASGRGDRQDEAGVTLDRSGASLIACRIGTRGTRTLPGAALVHIFVSQGEIVLATGERLMAGDTARMRSVPGLELTALASAEVLIWLFDEIHS